MCIATIALEIGNQVKIAVEKQCLITYGINTKDIKEHQAELYQQFLYELGLL
jgi:hypothetical protein